jgi:hypothetical protein
MNRYAISSKSDESFGVFDGDTPDEAFAAMVADAGGAIGDESVGTISDWIVTLAGTDDGLVLGAGMDLRALAERMGSDATEDDAEAFADLLRDAGFSGWTMDMVPEQRWMSLLTAAVDSRAL